MTNRLCYGDNLHVLRRKIASANLCAKALGRHSVAFCDLLLHFSYDIIEVAKPRRETLVVAPDGGKPLLLGRRVRMIDALAVQNLASSSM